MITPTFATIVLSVATLLLIVIIPILDGSKLFHRYISLRYTLVAISLIMALGCILDFSHLAESSRNIVLMGALILVGLFVLVRSLEKVRLGNKVIDISLERDGTKVQTKIEGHEDSEKHIVNEESNSSNICNE